MTPAFARTPLALYGSLITAAAALAPSAARAQTKVGPAHGTVIVVGGGVMGPEVYREFIASAGGPNALIVDVPTAGGDSVYGQNAPGTRGWKAAGATNVVVLHTINRAVANSDSFVAVLKKAGGVWFEGGRQFHLVDSYAGTKTEAAFREVLDRGGVIGGSSAGASILGDFLVRGAPSNDNFIMDYPGYEKGFAYLKGVGIDQHVVARERLVDLADSIMPKHPNLLGMSEDEGTAWVVRGDTAVIIGRDKAFVYGGKDPTDPGKPFLTLWPGDHYDLATRHVTHRAVDDSPVSHEFIASLFKNYNGSPKQATVLVARNGEVLIDDAFGVPAQEKYMPRTTLPQWPLGGISEAYTALLQQMGADSLAPRPGKPLTGQTMRAYTQLVNRRLYTPIGAHRTSVDSAGDFHSDVDELYRLELGLENPRAFEASGGRGGASPAPARAIDPASGWEAGSIGGQRTLSLFGVANGRRDAFVRLPDQNAVVVILTNDDQADARDLARRIAERLVSGTAR